MSQSTFRQGFAILGEAFRGLLNMDLKITLGDFLLIGILMSLTFVLIYAIPSFLGVKLELAILFGEVGGVLGFLLAVLAGTFIGISESTKKQADKGKKLA